MPRGAPSLHRSLPSSLGHGLGCSRGPAARSSAAPQIARHVENHHDENDGGEEDQRPHLADHAATSSEPAAASRYQAALFGGSLSPDSSWLATSSSPSTGAATIRVEQLTTQAKPSPRVKAITPGSVGSQRKSLDAKAGRRRRRARVSRYRWSIDSPELSCRSTA